MNFAGARGLPITYILQNNQIALDTPPAKQSGVELWADKAAAMGFPAWTIDGSDPAAWHASTAVAREFSMAGGGPTLIHVETMRGCGHAHHHDDLYLGNQVERLPNTSSRPSCLLGGKGPLPTHRLLLKSWVLQMNCLRPWRPRKRTPWSKLASNCLTCLGQNQKRLPKASHRSTMPTPTKTTSIATQEHQDPQLYLHRCRLESVHGPTSTRVAGRMRVPFSKPWQTLRPFTEMIASSSVRTWKSPVRFGMNMALKNAGHQGKLVDMPLCEAVIVHTGVGAALSGMKPMVEIQFGGFAALGFNALVNNAAMLRWRWGADCPMTVRIPLGARTRSGTLPRQHDRILVCQRSRPGCVGAGTPQDAYDLLLEGAHLPDPVLVLEHIGLYGLRGGLTGWGMNINQEVDTETVNQHLASGTLTNSARPPSSVVGAMLRWSLGARWFTSLCRQQRPSRVMESNWR